MKLNSRYYHYICDSLIYLWNIKMWIFLWDTAPSKIFVGSSEVASVWAWDIKVRPNEDPRLCFTALTAWSSVRLIKYRSPTTVTLQTSRDGESRSTYTMGSTISLSSIWDKVYFRNSSTSTTWFSKDNSNYYYFTMSWSIEGSWDIWYLLNQNSTSTIGSYYFYTLFSWCSALRKAPNLPATTLNSGCYRQMFQGCSNLEKAPDLPATNVPAYAYYSMFVNCSSLTTAPKLPATSIWNNCYYSMFQNCTSLETLPAFPATTLYSECYAWMFSSCSKIKLSTTQTWEYQTPYRIPTSWTWTTASNALQQMFGWTWWTFTWAPNINTTYYTSNTVV